MCTANVSCLSYIRNEKNCKKQRRQTFLDDLSLWGVGFWEDESRKLLGLFFTLLYSRIVPTWNCNLHRCTFLMWLPDKPKMGWKNLHLFCFKIQSQSWNTLFWNIISMFNAIMHFRCLLNQEGKRSVVCVCNWATTNRSQWIETHQTCLAEMSWLEDYLLNFFPPFTSFAKIDFHSISNTHLRLKKVVMFLFSTFSFAELVQQAQNCSYSNSEDSKNEVQP